MLEGVIVDSMANHSFFRGSLDETIERTVEKHGKTKSGIPSHPPNQMIPAFMKWIFSARSASPLVCGGILLSYPADLWNAPWLSYADAAASGIIGLLIIRGAVELLQELVKKGEDDMNISHFMKGAEERSREKVVFRWLTEYLKSTSQTIKELEERFLADLCEQTPKLMIITGMGYQPVDVRELHRRLDPRHGPSLMGGFQRDEGLRGLKASSLPPQNRGDTGSSPGTAGSGSP